MKRTVFRKMAAVFISLMLTVAMAVPAAADERLAGAPDAEQVGMIVPGTTDPKDNGECGDNLKYAYNKSTGTVTVSGTGATWDYDPGLGPNIFSKIFNVNGDVYTLRIESGVTELKAGFIPEGEKLVNILIPKSVKKIGSYNFRYSNRADYILYAGSKTDWNKIEIESGNYLNNVKVLYLGEWFTDVANGKDFFFKPVYWAIEEGITGGYGEGTFQPYFPCTRAMIVTFLYRRAGSPDVPGTNQFSDVKPTDWYYKSVSWAVKEGITTGYGAGTFQPDAPCTRAMIVTFLMRRYGPYAPYYEPVYKNIFPDVPKGAWYTDAVMWAYDMGVTTGRGGYFKPNDVCTRGEAVSFISRTIE